MTRVLDIKFIRYLNFFEKITRVRTNYCFNYNNYIYFAVLKPFFSKAIGKEGRNVRKISETLRKRIKIVAMPSDESGAGKFFSDIVSPYEIQSFKLENGEFVITASRQNKAGLIGRNRVRLQEMQDIADQFFEKKLKIV